MPTIFYFSENTKGWGGGLYCSEHKPKKSSSFWKKNHIFGITLALFKRLANDPIRLRVCAGLSEPLLVVHTTLLEVSCCGSNKFSLRNKKNIYINFAPLHVSRDLRKATCASAQSVQCLHYSSSGRIKLSC